MKELLAKLIERRDLSGEEAESAALSMMEGKVSEAEMASFLTALRMKGETAEELAAFARAMRFKARRVNAPESSMDVCGTGGGRLKSFNVSTAAAFVVAAAGIPVAKHGNRSYTGRSGSADVLEALGASIKIGPERASEMLERHRITFLFAPDYHPATKNVAQVRRMLGFRTIFNLLGPLTNPASVRRQLIGVSSATSLKTVSEALQLLGTERALVVHADVGMDEIAPQGRTDVIEIKDGEMESYSIEGSEFNSYGASEWRPHTVSDAKESAMIIRALLENGADSGNRALLLLNAGAALYIAGAAQDMVQGIERSIQLIEEGKAKEKLDEFISASRGNTDG